MRAHRNPAVPRNRGDRRSYHPRVSSRERLRGTFEQVPELYDRARPTYPPEVIDDLVELARVPPGGRVVEIGPGTGQATVALAERGLSVVGVELGAGLADFARRKLARFPRVEIVTAAFEDWEPDEADFDAVAAFTAFHWLDPEVRYAKSARLLRPGGALAVVETAHVLVAGGDPFWVEVQEDYDAVVPSPDNRPPPYADEVGDLRAELEASGFFGEIEVRRRPWDVTYTADEWIAVLSTYSPNLARDPATTRELFDRIHARIEARPGGRVTKHYLATVNVARRR
jgi:SAM-dependent methyltransferase